MLSEILNACRQGRADVEAYIVADAVKGPSLYFFLFAQRYRDRNKIFADRDRETRGPH
jgi:hypothetical protein